mgnify:CR=1 FL=1
MPRARMGYESIAYEAEGQIGYKLGGHEDERDNFLVKSNKSVKYRSIQTTLV